MNNNLRSPHSSESRKKNLRRIFIALFAIYLTALAGTIYIAISYTKYLGQSSPVQGWIDHNATSFSTEIYDAILNLKEVSQAYAEVQANKKLPLSHLTERIEILRGFLESFDPAVVSGKRLIQFSSYKAANESVNRYIDLITKWADTATPDRLPDQDIAEAETQALTYMRKLTIEALVKEFQGRDDMVEAIMASRELASNTFKIGILLYVFGAVALGSVYWASGAWVAAERGRFKRLEYLLATVGHELRSPLQAIVSSANLLRRTISYGENSTYVDIIRDSSGQLARLVNDLVGLARNEELSHVPQTICLSNWVDKTTARFRVEAERKGLKFIVDAPQDLPCITFDEARLTQCVGNLLGNAIRYTDVGSVKLKISIENHFPHEGLLKVEVRDTGPGIAAKEHERIFSPFVRASTDTDGMGLGLAIVSSIVRTTQGRISLNSELGKGSTFSLHLPVKYAFPPDRNLQELAQTPIAGVEWQPDIGGKVLIVDDDQAIATVLSAVVAEMGYPSDRAHDGEQALKMALETPYFAIITDIQMPLCDGFELAQACRERVYPCPALIAMTAYTNELSDDTKAHLFDKTLSKPVNDEELLTVLESFSRGQ